MIPLLLKNWKLIGTGIAVLSLCLFVWWVSGLVSDNKTLRNENTLMTAEIKYKNGFIEKYEKAKKENEAKQKKLSELVKGIENDPNCLAPDSFRKFIDIL